MTDCLTVQHCVNPRCFPCCRWMKDDMELDLKAESSHYSLMGGNLVISNPIKNQHVGKYSCLAINKYGTVVSQEASVQFGCKRHRCTLHACCDDAPCRAVLSCTLCNFFKLKTRRFWKLSLGKASEQLWNLKKSYHLSLSLPLSDLDLFSSEERESVYVKEGQGAVLLCAPPPHYPGTAC